ncbi:MAG: DivIVA domain-containing protein, partial [Acidimicrobiales bacterium]
MGSDRMPDINDLATIRDASFATTFRGFDKLEVRAFLQTLARRLDEVDEMRVVAETRAEEVERELTETLESDKGKITENLGDRVGIVLKSANDAAADRLLMADQEAAEVRSRAEVDAQSVRQSAEEAATMMLLELESKNSKLSELFKAEQSVRDRERSDELAAAHTDADEIRSKARAEGTEIIALSVAEGREMVAEAKLVRERILRDLSRRRTNSKVQLEQLRAGRDRLVQAIEMTADSVDDVQRELETAMPEARLAAESAGQTVAPAATVEQLESEIESARLIGHPLVEPDEVAAVVSDWDGVLQDDPPVEELDSDLLELDGDDEADDFSGSTEILLSELGDDRGGLFRRKKSLPPEANGLPNEPVPTVEVAAEYEEVRVVDPTLELTVAGGLVIDSGEETADVEDEIEPDLDLPAESSDESDESAFAAEASADEIADSELVLDEPVLIEAECEDEIEEALDVGDELAEVPDLEGSEGLIE